jgi:hypothetical protein
MASELDRLNAELLGTAVAPGGPCCMDQLMGRSDA